MRTTYGTSVAELPSGTRITDFISLGVLKNTIPLAVIQTVLVQGVHRPAPLPLLPDPVARKLRAHRELLLNWFRAKKAISIGATEGLANKLELPARKAYGFRTFRVAKIVLYHALGNLPEPESTAKF